MAGRVHRSIDKPPREALTWNELWLGPDKGLICCWERGRQKRFDDPELATRAEKGQLVILAWEGGVEKRLKIERKTGTLKYLATWQGLRGEDLDIGLEEEVVIVCSRTEQRVVFTAKFDKPETEEV